METKQAQKVLVNRKEPRISTVKSKYTHNSYRLNKIVTVKMVTENKSPQLKQKLVKKFHG